MKKSFKFIFSILLGISLFFTVGYTAQAEELPNEQIEILAGEPVKPVSFENLDPDTQASFISQGINPEETNFFQSTYEEVVNINPFSRAFSDTVLNYYYYHKILTYSNNKITNEAPYGHTYKTLNVRNGYSSTKVYASVSNWGTQYYRGDKMKVTLQYKVW